MMNESKFPPDELLTDFERDLIRQIKARWAEAKALRDRLTTEDIKIITDFLDANKFVGAVQYVFHKLLNGKGLREAKAVVELIKIERSKP